MRRPAVGRFGGVGRRRETRADPSPIDGKVQDSLADAAGWCFDHTEGTAGSCIIPGWRASATIPRIAA